MVANDYDQIKGLDFNEILSLVVEMTTVRLFACYGYKFWLQNLVDACQDNISKWKIKHDEIYLKKSERFI